MWSDEEQQKQTTQVRALMREIGVTQSDVARACGISPSALSMWMRSKEPFLHHRTGRRGWCGCGGVPLGRTGLGCAVFEMRPQNETHALTCDNIR